MKNFAKLFIAIVAICNLTIFCFSQKTQIESKASAVSVDTFTQEIIQIPSNTQISKFSFFKITFDSLSQVSINFYDSDKSLMSKVIIKEDALKRTIEYSISSPDSTTEWVKIERVGDLWKDTATATSSSGRNWYGCSCLCLFR